MSAKIFFCLKMQKPFNMHMYIYTYVHTYIRFSCGRANTCIRRFFNFKGKKYFWNHNYLTIRRLCRSCLLKKYIKKYHLGKFVVFWRLDYSKAPTDTSKPKMNILRAVSPRTWFSSRPCNCCIFLKVRFWIARNKYVMAPPIAGQNT